MSFWIILMRSRAEKFVSLRLSATSQSASPLSARILSIVGCSPRQSTSANAITAAAMRIRLTALCYDRTAGKSVQNRPAGPAVARPLQPQSLWDQEPVEQIKTPLHQERENGGG